MSTSIRRFYLAIAPALLVGQTMAACAAETLSGPFAAAVEEVVDGDTLRARVSIWLGQELRVLVRIRGIDAPEMRGRCDREKERARDATAALRRLVAPGAVVLTQVEGDKYFGRVLADVATPDAADVGALAGLQPEQ
jgi:endonuclease YncB( thermonuclease family)